MGFRFQAVGLKDEWYTPPHIFEAMNCRFDLDVASPGATVVPWIPADDCYTEASIEKTWHGFVWMNPPFGKRNGIVPWLEKFLNHGNGVGLVPDRTSAPWWQQYIPKMEYTLFCSPKIKFLNLLEDGTISPGDSPAQGTCLFSLGEAGLIALHNAARVGLGVLFAPINFE